MRLNDMKFDCKATLGDKLLLVDIIPYFKYDKATNKATEELEGYKYQITLPERKFEKLFVKIEKKPPIIDLEKEEIPTGTEVEFIDLRLNGYIMQGNFQVVARAEDVVII